MRDSSDEGLGVVSGLLLGHHSEGESMVGASLGREI